MSSAWLVAASVLVVGGILYISSGKKRRPTQHDLDPTLKKSTLRNYHIRVADLSRSSAYHYCQEGFQARGY